MRRFVLVGTVLALLASCPAAAQEWINTILPERSFDFGTVARGSKVRHAFLVVNRLDQEVRIASWKTKCGCTEVRIGAQVIPPGTQTTVEAMIDTTRFVGQKPSGLTLVLDKPSYAEVDLNVTCFIRGDVTLNPGLVDFGVVPRASATPPTTHLSLVYAGGQPGWGITGAQTRGASVKARIERSQESDGSSTAQVQYQIAVTFDPSAQSGYFKDEITLFTNDPSGQTIPISVVANVQSAVTVSPSPLVMGSVKPGETIRKTLLVRSAQPFKLTSVKPTKDELTVSMDEDASKPFHSLTLTFKAPSQPGPFHAVVEIETDLKGEPPARLTAFATVAP